MVPVPNSPAMNQFPRIAQTALIPAMRMRRVEERGYDAEQVDAEIAADKAREKSLGLIFGATPAAGMGPEPDASSTVSDAAGGRRD